MVLLTALLIGIVLMAFVIALHYLALSLIAWLMPRLRIPRRPRIMAVLFIVYLAHVLEIALFALAFFVLQGRLGLGGFSADFEPTPLNYFHFSTINFSTLGMSEIKPEGGLRVLAGLESLTGFLLLTWSASFGFTVMRDFWKESEDHGL